MENQPQDNDGMSGLEIGMSPGYYPPADDSDPATSSGTSTPQPSGDQSGAFPGYGY